MRAASAACIAYVNANNVAFRADLVTLVVAAGTTHRWTTWNSALTVTNFNRGTSSTFSAPPSAPIVEIGQEEEDEGLSVCTLDITLGGEEFKVGGKSLPVLAADGYFDGALITLDHLVMPTAGDVSLQSFVDFDGRVAEPDIGINKVTLRCRSWLSQLEAVMLPRRTYAPTCQWRVFDTATCALSEAANTTTGTVTVAGTASSFTADTVLHNHETYTASLWVSADETKEETRGWWDVGWITFNGNVTAALAGVRADVMSSDAAGVMTMANSLPAAPHVGDTFTITSGCSLDMPSCVRYANQARYGGFPWVPPNQTTPVR